MRFSKQLSLYFLVCLAPVSCRNPLRNHLEILKRGPAIVETTKLDITLAHGKVFRSYESIRAALAADNLDGLEAMKSLLDINLKEARKDANLSDILILEKARDALLSASHDNRSAFSRVSEQVVELYKRSGSHSLDLYYCPMAKGYAYWLQPKGEPIGNPYMGSKMASCGAKI